MKKVVMYSKPNCAHCDMAKRVLDSRGIPFTTIDVSEDKEARNKLLEAGFRSVPQLFIDEIHFGGYDSASKVEV